MYVKMDQSIEYHHLVFKKEEGLRLFPKVVDLFKDYPMFAVREVGAKAEGIHYHMLLLAPDWDDQKIRREYDKVRDGKFKEISRRSWKGTKYLCKGSSPNDYPEVVVNTIPNFTEDNIKVLHDQWWMHDFDTPKDPDYKEPKVLDLLVDWVKDRTDRKVPTTAREAMTEMVSIIKSKSGKKPLANKVNAQCMVRTALLFSLDAEKYERQIVKYFVEGIFGN